MNKQRENTNQWQDMAINSIKKRKRKKKNVGQRSSTMNLKEQVERITNKYACHLPDCELLKPHGGEIPCSCGKDNISTDILKVVKLDEKKIFEEFKSIRGKYSWGNISMSDSKLILLAKAIAQGDVYKDMKERLK